VLKPGQIDEIHRLHWHRKWSLREIARHLSLNRRTIAKYLITPAPKPKQAVRTSKLDAFEQAIDALLEQAPNASAVVILQRLRPLGYQGGISILKQYLQTRRQLHTPRVRARGILARRPVRNRLGPLRLTQLRRGCPQALRLLSRRMS